MKKIMSKKDFITGIIACILSIICICFYVRNNDNTRLIAAGIVLIVWSVYSFISAFTKKGTIEKAETLLDERDKLILMKSSHMSLSIINYICWGTLLVAMILFAILRQTTFLIIGYTLGGIILILLIVSLLVNRYYEKKF